MCNLLRSRNQGAKTRARNTYNFLNIRFSPRLDRSNITGARINILSLGGFVDVSWIAGEKVLRVWRPLVSVLLQKYFQVGGISSNGSKIGSKATSCSKYNELIHNDKKRYKKRKKRR